MNRLKISRHVVSFIVLSVAFFGELAAGDYNPLKYTTGTYHTCNPTGTGGDSYLNTLKNRDIPPDHYSTFTISDIIALPGLPGAARDHWSDADRTKAMEYESQGATVEGYIVGVRHEGPEACNCGASSGLRDYHLWLAPNATDPPGSAVVVEISPRLLDAHPGWDSKSLGKLKRQKVKVRISGWLLWDEKHGTSDSRATSWEVHPIHKIETRRSGDWIDFK
jgi:hypothetical protein